MQDVSSKNGGKRLSRTEKRYLEMSMQKTDQKLVPDAAKDVSATSRTSHQSMCRSFQG